jgi:ribonucleoside-diphosphate reductase alpha chain
MIRGIDYPEWLTEAGLKTLKNGYLLEGENVFDMYRRVAKAAASQISRLDLEDKFYEAMAKNWLCPATPVAANLGTDRGLPISCFGLAVPDSVDGIYKSVHEMAMLSKHGGGVGIGLSRVRGRGALIREGKNGKSEGVIPWAKVFDSATIATSQGNVRRGASSVNLHVDHLDINEFLRIRRQVGDVNRQCLNINHCVIISDSFMKKVENKDAEARKLWIEILKTRLETGEPYLLFEDTVNRANPEAYIKNNLKVEMTNICSEITLHTDDEHSFVCCLSSLNAAKWDEWKDTDLPQLAVYFLDGVVSEFISKAKNLPGFERSVRFAEKSRAIGIGVLGWHTLLQSQMIPFESFSAMQLNALLFKTIRDKAVLASQEMARSHGEPEWCSGTGMRHTHLMAIAPTRSNSIISGEVSYGIEPIPANAYADKTAKGVFLVKNPTFEALLKAKGQDTSEVWKTVVGNGGSVQHLKFLTEQEKRVFLTAREINQMALIQQAAQRQKFIDQAQSLNLFFPVNVDPKWFNEVHMEAWRLGVKTLYYCRSSSVLKADAGTRQAEEGPKNKTGDECLSCHG